MHKRLLFIGLLAVGVALLSGCELLDQIIDAITGGGTPGGDISYGGEPSGGEIVDAHIQYWLMVTLLEQDWPDAPITTRVGPIAAGFQPDTTATFQPDPGTYNTGTKTFTATWDGGDFSDTYLEVRLSDTEEYVNFHVRQTQSDIRSVTGNVWTHVNELRGYNIQHSHWSQDRRSRYYEVLGVGAGAFDLLTHEAWVYDLELGSTFLGAWVNNSVHDIIPDPGNHIYIQVEYSEPQP